MPTENDLKKEYLWGYRKAMREVKRLELKIKEMRLDCMLPTVVADGMPHTHGGNDLSEYAARLDQEERKYMKARYKRIRKCKEICDRIERLKKEDEKDVLMYRYIKVMNWEEIATAMKYTERHVQRIHGRALKNFNMS